MSRLMGHASPPLVAVAHGSRDPRSAAAVMRLVEVVRALRPGLDARVAFLDLSAPRLVDVLAALHGEGHREPVVVPLLLGNAYHACVDVPAMAAEAVRRLPRLTVTISEVLGPDPRLESAALRNLAAAGVRTDDPEVGVVLAGAGSSHAPANEAVAEIARKWTAQAGWAGVQEAFAAAAEPNAATAVARLRARGARRIAVASWFLAPGLLPDRIYRAARETDPDVRIAAPLAGDPEVAELILHRYDETQETETTSRPLGA